MSITSQLHSREHRHPRGWLTLVIILLVIIGWYAVLGFGVYSGRWHGQKTQAVLRWTPLPAAMVDWKFISYGAYLDQRQAVDRYTAYLQTSSAGVYQSQTQGDISATTITKMIRLKASEKVLGQLKVRVSAGDVHQAYTSQLLQNGDAEQVQSTIRQLYGWTPEQFKANVIRPAIIRDKIQEKLSFDESMSGAEKKQAQEVLALLKEGKETFSDIAKKYSDDVYGTNGGDLGFVKQGEQAQEIDEAAFTVDINQLSDIIHTKYGYHIIKPVERKTVDGVEQVHLFQITILAPQVDDYLNTQLKDASVQIYIRGLGWDTSNVRAVKK